MKQKLSTISNNRKKRIVVGVTATIFAVVLAVFISSSSILGTQPQTTEAAQVVEEPSTFQKQLEPIFTTPDRLKIVRLNMDIKLVNVGVSATGQMETPQNWNEGGWYKRAAKPGEPGNIIINAHYDTSTGAPAAFWELKNIMTDDTVVLIDDYGREYTYRVTEFFYVNIHDPERLKILNEVEDKSELTLITCGGVWQPALGTYDNRFVVKAELID